MKALDTLEALLRPAESGPAWSAERTAACLAAFRPLGGRVYAFGRSALGRPLLCLELGEGGSCALFAAAQHANEWLTSPALLWAALQLALDVPRGVRLAFVPLANPDGVDLVTGALDGTAACAAAREIAGRWPQLPFPGGWKADIRGTDLNLQYPAGWEAAREIKFAQGWTGPAPRDYVGAAPLSAAESRALYSLARRLRPAAAAVFHSQGGVIYWRYHGFAPPGAEALAARLSAASGYALDDAPDASGNAGFKDWAIDSLGIPAFTVECGLGENPLPVSQLEGIRAAAAAICREIAAWCAPA